MNMGYAFVYDIRLDRLYGLIGFGEGLHVNTVKFTKDELEQVAGHFGDHARG